MSMGCACAREGGASSQLTMMGTMMIPFLYLGLGGSMHFSRRVSSLSAISLPQAKPEPPTSRWSSCSTSVDSKLAFSSAFSFTICCCCRARLSWCGFVWPGASRHRLRRTQRQNQRQHSSSSVKCIVIIATNIFQQSTILYYRYLLPIVFLRFLLT